LRTVLEFLRRDQRLTQVALARVAGVGQSALSKYERGLAIPDAHLKALAGALGLPESLAYVLPLSPAPHAPLPPPDLTGLILATRARQAAR
jgi:transcriptional regulator with XRE-family HTH domain